MKNLTLLGFCLALFSTQWSAQRDVDVQKLQTAQSKATAAKYLVLNIDKDLSEEAPISQHEYFFKSSQMRGDMGSKRGKGLKECEIYVSPKGELSTYDWNHYSKDFTTPEAAAEYIEKYRSEKAKEDEEEAQRLQRQRERVLESQRTSQRHFQIRQQQKSKAAAG